jgi:predicted alpha/beta-hydrolase family hydrolase
MKKFGILVGLFVAICMVGSAQIVKSKVVDNGGSGPYKAIVATEQTLQDFTIYRPENINEAVKTEGKLSILAFANGGCSNTSITHEKVLSEMASQGYIVIALGAMQMTFDDREHGKAEATMLIDAIDWISNQSKNKESDYYKKVDLKKIAIGGQSCGGAQVLFVAKDPRVKTYLMFNTGIGDMTMADASKASLKNLHGPVVYIVGGESDVAYANALLDFERISDVPVAVANLVEGGHMGTFGDKYGGSFARMATDWLDWQLKGKDENSSIFLESDLSAYPGWTMDAKNFKK